MADETLGWVQGDTAPEDRYEVYGRYEDVDDGEGGTVSVERLYDAPRLAAELEAGERGVLLVAAGSRVPAAVATRLAEA